MGPSIRPISSGELGKIIVTTTRHTNQRVRSFVKDLAQALYNAVKINRGKLSLPELVHLARDMRATRVIIVGRGRHGNPGRIVFLDTARDSVCFLPLILWLRGIALTRELHVRSSPPPEPLALILEGQEVVDDDIEFAQHLAIAFNAHLVHASLDSVAPFYSRAVLIEKVGSKDLAYVVKFVQLPNRILVGPKLLIARVIYRRPVNEGA